MLTPAITAPPCRTLRRCHGDGPWLLTHTVTSRYANAPDTNYDLALFRWGVGTLVKIADTGLDPSLKSDPSYPRWREVIRDLAPPPSDPETGLLIGDGVELAHGILDFPTWA